MYKYEKTIDKMGWKETNKKNNAKALQNDKSCHKK